MADPSRPRAAFAPWDRRELPGAFTVEESARRVGNYKWIEMRLFEALGGWVATVPELDVKMRLGTHCYHHAWHAELWHKRLPELREMNPDRLTAAGQRRARRLHRRHDRARGARQTIEKLVGVYRVLIPHKIAAYTYHLNNTSTITDAPTIRSLKFVLQDEFEDWRDGEMLIQSLIETPKQVERAAAHQAKLEKLMLAAGGIAGPGSIGTTRFTDTGEAMAQEVAHEEDLPAERAGPRRALRAQRDHGRASTIPRVGNQGNGRRGPQKLTPSLPDAPERRARADARHLRRRDPGARGRRPHLLGLRGRQGHRRHDEVPFELKLDMARQCWDEARHCEISVKLGDWMGTEIGEFAEQRSSTRRPATPTRSCASPASTARSRAWPSTSSTPCASSAQVAGDPVLEFCEDWMLADEVTHVKMGSDWLRRLTENDPERRAQALEFQRIVDKLFSLGGFRGEEDDSPIRLARRFRELAGFDDEEIDEIAELSAEAARRDGAAAWPRRQPPTPAADRWPRSPSRPRRSRWSSSTRPRSRRWSSGGRPGRPPADVDIELRGRRDGAARRACGSLSIDPVVLEVEGGAFEDPKRPASVLRALGARATCRPAAVPGPGSPRPDVRHAARREELDVAAAASRGTPTPSAACRRLGYDTQRQRWLYAFRNRHGFTDGADAAFERLWSGPG